LVASVTGGEDLPRLQVSRLRSTWLVAVAQLTGLRSVMDAAGITCSQHLGDVVAMCDPTSEATSVAVLGGSRGH
jgi:hypothetical protein